MSADPIHSLLIYPRERPASIQPSSGGAWESVQ